jgi:hypothetical protein
VLLFLLVASALATATPAAAAIFVRLTTTSAHHGGVLRAVGNAAHMPLYALPAARMPCARYGTVRRHPFIEMRHRDERRSCSSDTRQVRPAGSRLPSRFRFGSLRLCDQADTRSSSGVQCAAARSSSPATIHPDRRSGSSVDPLRPQRALPPGPRRTTCFRQRGACAPSARMAALPSPWPGDAHAAQPPQASRR